MAVKSKDVGTIAKILAGGLTFNINTPGKKNALGPSITCPLTNSGYRALGSGNFVSTFSILKDSLQIINAIGRLKEIRVLNFRGITDTVQSIYNEFNIKTNISYSNAELVIEIMIPRLLIGLDNNLNLFSFQIILNGVPMPWGIDLPPGPPPRRAPSSGLYIATEIRSKTNFWGEYTLAKKP